MKQVFTQKNTAKKKKKVIRKISVASHEFPICKSHLTPSKKDIMQRGLMQVSFYTFVINSVKI